MSTFSLMNIGASALSANQAALTTAGHNIANVNTAGYSRQQVLQTAREGQLTGYGFVGRGVDAASVLRTRDSFLNTNAQQALSLSSADAVRASNLSQLETLFPVGESGLGAATANLFSAFSDMQSVPNDTTSRTAVLARADELAARFQSTAYQIGTIQTRINEQMESDVIQINSLATQIASVNQQIFQYKGTNYSPNDLLDQRDQLVSDLNKLVQTTTIPAADGSLGVFIAGGQPLVLGPEVSKLKLIPDPTDNALKSLVIAQSGMDLGLDFSSIGGGELAGLLRFQTQDLDSVRDQVGFMALAVANVVNNQHKLGLDASGSPAGPLFTIPVISGAADPQNAGAGTAKATVNDPTGTKLRASDYTVSFTSGTTGTVTRMSDGTVQAFASLATFNVDGLDFNLTAGSVAGDQFVLKPGSVAAQISVAVNSPQKLAATPLAFEFGMQNSGTLAVTSLRGPQQGSALTSPQTNPYLTSPVTLTFTGAGTFNVNGDGTGNPTGVAYPPVTAPPLPANAISYNGWIMVLSGTPAAGDVITLKPFSSVGEIHTNLLAGGTLNDAYSTILATVGTQVQGAQSQAKLSSAISSDATTALTSTSGVNLDEEAAKLLQYQQSYQASAKILQVAQTIFDTLLSTVSR